ncbi:hypothetical protein HZH68_006023 [Vespula germanica]|uniref:Uncharacterized protein n=1 Tax=Vespula germanica TaxID=30212 RepID=A0A834KE98_VESGE|nr:hypothetical protein HZH68_006023 [Vespula germanica]
MTTMTETTTKKTMMNDRAEAVHGPDVQRDATVVTSASEQQRDTARFSSTIYVSRQLRYPSSSTLARTISNME